MVARDFLTATLLEVLEDIAVMFEDLTGFRLISLDRSI
jgi:hypothetical protein